MTKKNIVYLDIYTNVATNLFKSLKSLSKNDYDLKFVGPKAEKFYWSKVKPLEGTTGVWERGHYIRRLNNFIKSTKPDLVHISFELRMFGNLKSSLRFPLLLFLLKKKTKIIVTLHNIFIHRPDFKTWELIDDIPFNVPDIILSALIRFYLRLICKFSNKIVVLTKGFRDGLIEYYGIDPGKIAIIPYGISKVPSFPTQKTSKIIKKLESKRIILFFGIITTRKDYLRAISAFHKVAEQLPNHVLVFAGKTVGGFENYELKCKELIKKLDLENRVIFTGFLEDFEVHEMFKMAESTLCIYKSSSNWPESITYSQKYGKPTIVTKIDSFCEILNENDAIFVDPNNTEELSEAIFRLANDEKLRQQLGIKFKELAEENTWNKIAEKLWKTYDELLAAKTNTS